MKKISTLFLLLSTFTMLSTLNSMKKKLQKKDPLIELLNQRLLTIIKRGDLLNTDDLIHVKTLLEKKADPNAYEKSHLRAIMHAVEKNNEKLVELLLHYKANPNLSNKIGDNSLTLAAYKENQKIIKLLVECKAELNHSLNLCNKSNYKCKINNPLIIAIHNNNHELIKLFLDLKANPYVENYYYDHQKGDDPFDLYYKAIPLIAAAKKGNINCIQALFIDYTFNPLLVTPEVYRCWLTAFEHLVKKDHLKCVEIVLEHTKKTDLEGSSNLSLRDHFMILQPGKYKQSLRSFIIFLLIINRKKIILPEKETKIVNLFSKYIIFNIINLTLDSFPHLHNILERDKIRSENARSKMTREMRDMLFIYDGLLDKTVIESIKRYKLQYQNRKCTLF